MLRTRATATRFTAPNALTSLALWLLLSLVLAACGGNNGSGGAGNTPATPSKPASSPVSLTVFAAASLTTPFKEIGARYEQAHPGVIVTFNFAGSQVLEQQIANGAAADLFASADKTNMQKASDAGLVVNQEIFVKNKLVIIVPSGNPAGITSLKDLAKKGTKIDIAAPSVPAGKYSRQVLDNMAKSPDFGPAYRNAVLGNIVSQEDNVKAVLQKIQLGEADAGYVYQSDVTPSLSSKIKLIEIPAKFNIIAQYPIAVLKNSAHAAEALKFELYILSPDGQEILVKNHFIGIYE